MNIGRNDKCPCGSGKKYKRCHGSPNGLVDSLKNSSVTCICGSKLNPIDCCGSFLVSPRRIKSLVDKSQFTIINSYKYEYTGKVYFTTLSIRKREWNVFRDFYLYGFEVNERFFRPKTLDVVFEIGSDDVTHWTVKCNLDYQTGATLKFQTLKNHAKGKLQITDCIISVTEQLNQIEVPYLRIVNNQYLRLFHHTSVLGYEGITSTRTIWVSPYDLQGSTRKLTRTHFAYFTDLPELRFEGDLFAVAMREKGKALFRTDDLAQYDFVDIYENPPSKRERRVVFYIDLQLIAPVPAIFHFQDGSKYIEFFHPHIFRVGTNPDEKIPIEKFNDGWKISKDSIQPKAVNIYPIANGNSLSDVLKIYQDRYIEP